MNRIILIIMFALQALITIGKNTFTQVNHVKITKSWKSIGQSAIIKLPRLNDQIEKDIQVGDLVNIQLGYKDEYFDTEFDGIVSKIGPKMPFEIECEDSIFYAKRTNLKQSFKDTTLKEVINYIITQVNLENGTFLKVNSELPEVNFSKFRLNNITALAALKKIKDDYGLVSYFNGVELFTGLPITDISKTNSEVGYSTSWNIIKSNLDFISSEDRKIQINAIGVLPDNTRTEIIKVGDEGGALRTLYFYKISDESKIKELAEAEMSQLKYSGFQGDFKTFLIPYATHSMVANIDDSKYNEGRSGKYLIDSVTIEFGVNGARRRIELGVKLG